MFSILSIKIIKFYMKICVLFNICHDFIIYIFKFLYVLLSDTLTLFNSQK